MAAIQSNLPNIGYRLPDIVLPDVHGNSVDLNTFDKKKVMIVMFLSGHCPYVQALEDRILALAKFFADQSVQFIAICSNDSSAHPEDSPEALAKRVAEKGYTFPYLIDAEQKVAKAFDAACTPDFFVLGDFRTLRYRGRLDDSAQDPNAVTKEDLKEAITAVLNRKTVDREHQIPSMGCSIKWK